MIVIQSQIVNINLKPCISQKRLKGSRFDLIPELLDPTTQIHFIKGKDVNGIARVSTKNSDNS